MKTIKVLILVSLLLTMSLILHGQTRYTLHTIQGEDDQYRIEMIAVVKDTLPENEDTTVNVVVSINADTLEVDTALIKIDTTEIQVGNIKIIIRTSENGGKAEVINIEGLEDSILQEGQDKISGALSNVKEKRKLKNLKTRTMMLDLGVNGYLYNNSLQLPAGYKSMDLNPGKSINVKLHLFRQRLNLVNHNLNLMYGLTLDMHNYRFMDNYTLAPRMDTVTPLLLDGGIRKTKLADTWLELPVLLNIETNPWNTDRSFRINAGAYAGYLLEAHTKVRKTDKSKIKEKDDFNMQKFRYGVIGQVGYGWFNVFADYSLTDLFNPGEGPVLTPFTVGLVIIGF